MGSSGVDCKWAVITNMVPQPHTHIGMRQVGEGSTRPIHACGLSPTGGNFVPLLTKWREDILETS